MPTLGVIAEYNPFHQGHLYHLETAKQRVPGAAVIAVMSGSFVQRGEPALVHKWARAETALAGGVDLVFELPVLYAVRSAYWFARGALETLRQTGLVTHLTFGAECGDAELLKQASAVLADEPPSFSAALKAALKKGFSYPRARGEALDDYFNQTDHTDRTDYTDRTGQPDVFRQPNNILGLNYLRVLAELNYPLLPIIVARQGSAYHREDIGASGFASATALRLHLLGKTASSRSGDHLSRLADLRGLLPEHTYTVLGREFQNGRGPVSWDDLALPIMTILRRSKKEDLTALIDVTEGLENRILKLAQQCTSPQEFLAALKTKRYTYTRLQRFLIHLLLNYSSVLENLLPGGPPYLRVLGFTPRGQRLLREIKKKSVVPIITKAAHAKKHASSDPRFYAFWEMDALAANLYTLLYPNESLRRGNPDLYTGPVSLG